MPSILIVCTGNICRSPMGMALLRSKFAERDETRDWVVESAGTWAPDGSHASEHGITAMRERGLEAHVLPHRARSVTAAMLQRFDLVLTMTQSQKEALGVEFPEAREKIYLLSEMVDEHWDVDDPIGGPLEAYRKTAALLDDVLDRGLERIIALAKANASRPS